MRPCHNVSLHLSPGPKMIVGHFYPNGLTGAREERFRISYATYGRNYEAAVRRIKKSPRDLEGSASALFSALAPFANLPHRGFNGDRDLASVDADLPENDKNRIKAK